MSAWANQYLGVPFVSKGRERAGADCYGLVCLVYAEQFGVDLDPLTAKYEADVSAEHMAALFRSPADSWDTIEPGGELPGDVILLSRSAMPTHCGIVVGGGRFIHCDRGTGTAVEPYRTGRWLNRVAGFGRWTGGKTGNACADHAITGVCARVKRSLLHPGSDPLWIPPGGTLADAFRLADFPAVVADHAVVKLNGEAIPPEFWGAVKPKPGSTVELIIRPGGLEQYGITNSTLRLAFTTITQLGAGLLSTAVGGWGGAAVAAVVGLGGALAVSAIIPPDPLIEDEASLSISAGQNAVTPYGKIPALLGKHRIYPPYGARVWTEVIGDDQYVNILLVLGVGPISIDPETVKIGDTAVTDYSDVQMEIRQGLATDAEPTLFLQAVNESVLNVLLEQEQDSVLTLAEGDGTGGTYTAEDLGWALQTISTDCSKISVDLTFPRGLVRTVSGTPSGWHIDLQCQYRENLDGVPGAWRNVHPSINEAWSQEEADATDLDRTIAWLTTLNTDIDNIADFLEAISAGDQEATAGAIASIADSMDTMEARIDDLIDELSGSDAVLLETLQDNFGRIGGWFANAAIVAAQDLDQGIQNAISDLIDSMDQGYGLLEVLAAIQAGQGPALYTYPFWMRLLIIFFWNAEDIFDGEPSPDVFRVTDERAGQFRITASWPVANDDGVVDAATEYDVRVRRVTEDSTDLPDVTDQVYWTALRAHSPNPPIDIDNVSDIRLRIRATDQLSGSINQVNVVGEGMFKTYTASLPAPAYSTWEYSVTRNPAWLLCHILCGPQNHAAISADRLDMERIQEWATWCDDNGNGEAHYYDRYLKRGSTVLRMVKEVCTAGRAAFTMRDGLFSVVMDVEQTVAVQRFTPHNSSGFRSQIKLYDAPHGLKIRFNDEGNGWERDEMIVYSDGYSASNATVFEQMNLSGITSADRVHREARYNMAVGILRPELMEFKADWEQLLCTIGDLILLTHDVPMFGLASGRVQGVASTTVELSEAVPMDTIASYVIRFWLDDGTNELRAVTNPVADGYYTSITIASTVTDLAYGDLFQFGESGSESREMIVKEIHPAADLAAKIVCVDHAPTVHDYDQEEIPAYDPGISHPPEINLPPPDPPVILNVIADGTVLVMIQGTVQSQIVVCVGAVPFDAVHKPSLIEGQYRRVISGDGERGPWRAGAAVPSNSNQIGFAGVLDREYYDVRVRYQTPNGLVSDWTTESSVYVFGRAEPPPDVDSVDVQGFHSLRWYYANPPLDHAGFKVRVGFGHDVTWEEAEPAHADLIRATTWEIPLVAHGSLFYLVKAVDTSGNLSMNAVSVSVEVPGRVRDNVIVRRATHEMEFPGARYNCYVQHGTHHLVAAGGPYRWAEVEDVDLMWSTDEDDLMWSDRYPTMTYHAWWTAGADEPGTTWTVDITADADVWQIYYRIAPDGWVAPPASDGSISGDFWPSSMSDDLFPDDMEGWTVWPGEVPIPEDAEGTTYQLKMVFPGAGFRARVLSAAAYWDLPDKTEFLEDFRIEVGGGQLPITRTYRAIKAVNITVLQVGGSKAEHVDIVDKDPTGPHVIAYSANGITEVAAYVDVGIRGY